MDPNCCTQVEPLSTWQEYDENLIAEEMVTLVVQVNGKVRGRLEMTTGNDKEENEQLALAAPKSSLTLKAGKFAKLLLFLSVQQILFAAEKKI